MVMGLDADEADFPGGDVEKLGRGQDVHQSQVVQGTFEANRAGISWFSRTPM